MNALEVRKALTEDLEFLASVLILADQDRLAGREGWDREQFVDRCRTQTGEEVTGKVANSLTSVVEADGVPVGRLRVVRTSEELFIAGIQVLPEHQGRGIGSRVVRSVIDEGRREGLPVRLEVGKDNPDAKLLYLRLGFSVIEDRDTMELMEIRPDA